MSSTDQQNGSLDRVQTPHLYCTPLYPSTSPKSSSVWKWVFDIIIIPTLTRFNILIGLVGRVFANGPEELGSIPGHVIPKTLKMALDATLLNTQHYKVRIKGTVEQSREKSSALPYTSVL